MTSETTGSHSLRVAVRTTAVPLVDLGLRAIYDSGRHGRPGSPDTDPYFLTHASIATRDLDPLRVSLIGENLMDVWYAHPAGAEFLQASHAQDGRTLTLRVDLGF